MSKLRAAVWGWLASMLWMATSAVAGERLVVMSYNVESGGANPQVVKTRVSEHPGVDVWGFSEVQSDQWTATFEQAAEQATMPADYRRETGSTGSSDRLAVVYNHTRLEMTSKFELHRINRLQNVRSALVVKLRLRSTGQEFQFMVNHLWRGSAAGRHRQALALNRWARDQTMPVVAVGDYNFDWDVDDGDHNHDEGYDLMTEDDVFQWVRPATLVASQTNPQFNSVLDFVFVSGAAQQWTGTSEIIVKAGDVPNDNQISDHRPVRASFELPDVGPVGPEKSAPFSAAESAAAREESSTAATIAKTAAKSAPVQPPTTVIVLRHAEKENEMDDTPLSAAGRERAAELARVLGGVDVKAIYATTARRTQETVHPLATAKSLTITIPTNGSAAWLKAHITQHHRSKTVVVCGHSDTVGPILQALGMAGTPSAINGHEDLFVATVYAQGQNQLQAKVLPMKYGRGPAKPKT